MGHISVEGMGVRVGREQGALLTRVVAMAAEGEEEEEGGR